MPVRAEPARRRRRWPALVAATLIGAVAAVAVVVNGGVAPRGGVLSEVGSPAPPSSAAATAPGPAPTPSPEAAAESVVVVDGYVREWVDVLGGRHGQALFVVENRATDPMEVMAAGSTFRVADGKADYADGQLEAVVPPVLAPGERGYAFASFSLPARLPDAASASADLEVRPATGSVVELRVRQPRVDLSGPTLAIVGDVRNAGSTTTTDGVVGAVLLNDRGVPVFGLLDPASAARLRAGARDAFRAAYPAIPVDRYRPSTVVAYGWASGEGN